MWARRSQIFIISLHPRAGYGTISCKYMPAQKARLLPFGGTPNDAILISHGLWRRGGRGRRFVKGGAAMEANNVSRALYSTETRVALVKERVRAKERQRQMRVYAAALVLAALAAGIALGAVLRSGTKTKEEMT